jgi:hypothetical protein
VPAAVRGLICLASWAIRARVLEWKDNVMAKQLGVNPFSHFLEFLAEPCHVSAGSACVSWL